MEKELPDINSGDTLTAEYFGTLKALIRARRVLIHPDGGLTGAQGADGLSLAAVTQPFCEVFWTTSAITSSSSTGTTLATARLTYGHGTARRCKEDRNGSPIPDLDRIDETIYEFVRISGAVSNVNAGMFVLCIKRGNRWVVVDTEVCPYPSA